MEDYEQVGSKMRREGYEQARRKERRVPFLHEDIIYEILSWNSADFLHNVGRFICKSWAVIISTPHFMNLHLSHSNTLSFCLKNSKISLIDFNGCNFQVNHLKENIPGDLVASSAGLLLFKDYDKIHLSNPVTRQTISLDCPYKIAFHDSFSLGFIAATGEIKIVCRHITDNQSIIPGWGILTVGRNASWRLLNDHTLSQNLPIEIAFFCSLSVGDFAVYHRKKWMKDKKFIVVDLRDESFHILHTPEINEGDIFRRVFVTGRSLFVVSIPSSPFCGEKERKLRIWKLGNFRKSEWFEVFNIEMDSEDLKSFLSLERVQFLGLSEQKNESLVLLAANDINISMILCYNYMSENCFFLDISDCYKAPMLSYVDSVVSW